MSDFYNSIKQGLTEAIEYSEGKCPKAIVHQFSSIDVKNIRSNLGMTQIEFASAFGISVSTLCHWEFHKVQL
jgi:putative transcriptional regulator